VLYNNSQRVNFSRFINGTVMVHYRNRNIFYHNSSKNTMLNLCLLCFINNCWLKRSISVGNKLITLFYILRGIMIWYRIIWKGDSIFMRLCILFFRDIIDNREKSSWSLWSSWNWVRINYSKCIFGSKETKRGYFYWNKSSQYTTKYWQKIPIFFWIVCFVFSRAIILHGLTSRLF
jgi:hypothetical protein